MRTGESVVEQPSLADGSDRQPRRAEETAEAAGREQGRAGDHPRRFRLRQGSALSLAAVLVTAIFLATISFSVWNTARSQRRAARQSGLEKLRAVGNLLAESADALLAAEEMTALRRVVAQTGVVHDLELCRVVLPDGRVIADADPARIALPKLPPTWTGQFPEKADSLEGEKVSLTWPLEVPGRGRARLEISTTIKPPAESGLDAQTAQLVAAGVALGALLLVYRHARLALRAIRAIRQALLARRAGEQNAAALEVSPRYGPEADAWNALLAENEQLAKQLAMVGAKEALLSKAGPANELGAACDALPHGLILVDSKMRAKYANGAAAVFLQSSPDKLIGSDLREHLSEPRVVEAVENAASGPTYKRTILEIERDGSPASGVLRLIIRPVRREDSGVAMIIIEDITQQRVAEEARNAFLAQATHELRTPLTNIRLYVESALEQGQEDAAGTAKCLNVINEESRRLERIVADVLSVSEIEAGAFKVNRDDVRMDALLEQLKADYEPQAGEKNIELIFDLPPKLPVLHADRDKISLALHNLLGNALKYTPENGRVTLNVAVDSKQLAIDKDKRLANIAGSGLGLALAREVVRLHGGDITVQSELNKGSIFTMTLPVSEEAA